MSTFTLWPSKAFRWQPCPGSVQAEAYYPDVPSDTADEGIITHELVAPWIDELARAGSPVIPDDPRYTSEIIEGAILYSSAVRDAMIKLGCFTPKVEQVVPIPRVHPLNGGRLDCSLWSPGNLTLWIFDLKMGRRVVEHVGNWQNIDYAIGELDQITGNNGLAEEQITVSMTIVQPRAYHVEGTVRTWTVKGSDLRGYANQLALSAEQSQQPEPPTKAGPHCYKCKAAKDCLTLQQAAAEVVDRVQTLQLHALNPANRGVELDYLTNASELIKSRLDALEVEALAQAQKGTATPGYGIGYGRGSKVWTKPVKEVIELGDLLGVNLRKAEDCVTPTQAINEKKVDEAVINAYSEKQKGKARLVRVSETVAARIFGNNKIED